MFYHRKHGTSLTYAFVVAFAKERQRSVFSLHICEFFHFLKLVFVFEDCMIDSHFRVIWYFDHTKYQGCKMNLLYYLPI